MSETLFIEGGRVVDPASGSWDVLAELVGPLPDDLRPGMAVDVHWPPEPAPNRH